MTKVFAEINEAGNRINVYHQYDGTLVMAIKELPNRQFKKIEEGGPYWIFPLDLATARAIRKAVVGAGHEIEYGRALTAWGKAARKQLNQIGKLTTADSANLSYLPSSNPALFKFVSGRPYQTADIKFMSVSDNPGNFNAPGGGKTAETIACLFESKLEIGYHLIVAPVTSLDPVWLYELDRWCDEHYLLMTAYSDPLAQSVYNEALKLFKAKEPFVLVTNPYAVQLDVVKKEIYNPISEEFEKEEQIKGIKSKQIAKIKWTTTTVDEFHKCGLGNRQSLTRRGLVRLQSQKRMVLSGTPIGGKTRKLWAILNYLEPNIFTSYWQWARMWLSVTAKEVRVKGTVKIVHEVEDIKPGLEEEFYRAHSRYFCRRTRAEMRKDIPGKQRIIVSCPMGPAQKKQYEDFQKKAELRIEEHELNAIGILAEYTRLRQFAISKVTLEPGRKQDTVKVRHTDDSCKLEQLMAKLGEHGIVTDDEEDRGTEQAIVFSQFTEVIELVARALAKKKVPYRMLTGATKQQERGDIVRAFESRQVGVLLMNTAAGGVSITLNQSESIHFMDETFVPDDQEQAEDRNRDNSAVIYVYRTPDTIEEHVADINFTKRGVNKAVLDLHRKRLKDIAGVESALAG